MYITICQNFEENYSFEFCSLQVFHPKLKRCVIPEKEWECQQHYQDIFQLPYYNELEEDNGEQDEETENQTLVSLDLTTADETETQQNLEDLETTPSATTENHLISGLTYDPSSSVLNAMEQDRVPLSIVNNTSIDQIGNQMHRLTQLINSLKASPTAVAPPSETTYGKVTPVVYSALPQKPPHHSNPSRNTLFPYSSPDSPEYEINLLPTQLNKITAQLIMQTPMSNKEPTNLNLLAMDTLKHSNQNLTAAPFISNSLIHGSTEHLVSALFQKYLTNSSFMNKGEYVKKTPILIPVTTTRKPELNPKQSDNSIIQLPDEHRPAPPKSSVPSFLHTNAFYGKSCVNGIRLPNPADCTRYFLCNSSTTTVQSYACPPNTAFNKFKRICDVTEYQRCVKQIGGYLKNEEAERHNKIPCDTQMCGGLQNFGELRDRRFNCPGTLEFCEKRQRCLPVSLCR